ncbi:hypothetical protein ACQP3D_30670, partial [Escherichia coli]
TCCPSNTSFSTPHVRAQDMQNLRIQTPSLVGEMDTKAIMAQRKSLKSCQSAVGAVKNPDGQFMI